jgi:hypothetical protein
MIYILRNPLKETLLYNHVKQSTFLRETGACVIEGTLGHQNPLRGFQTPKPSPALREILISYCFS